MLDSVPTFLMPMVAGAVDVSGFGAAMRCGRHMRAAGIIRRQTSDDRHQTTDIGRWSEHTGITLVSRWLPAVVMMESQ